MPEVWELAVLAVLLLLFGPAAVADHGDGVGIVQRMFPPDRPD